MSRSVGSPQRIPDPEPASRWLADRSRLRADRAGLTVSAIEYYPTTDRIGTAPILTRPGWVPTSPLPLDEIRLIRSAPPPPADPTGDRWPAGSYAGTVAALAPPRLLENRRTYHLRSACLTSAEPYLEFGVGPYFDVLDLGEAVAHEFAAASADGLRPDLDDLPLRSSIPDPTDLGSRPAPAAITMLTVRAAAGRSTVLVHWRDPAKVATNGDRYQVVPAGMFQPARTPDPTGATGSDPDFDLWRCAAREYSEELLGRDEHVDVDYDDWGFFARLERARRAGACRPYLLGVAVDPLSFAVDLLAVAVFDAATFDELFAGLVTENAEGRILQGADPLAPGLPFDIVETDGQVLGGRMQPAGSAVLELAWRQRRTIGIPA